MCDKNLVPKMSDSFRRELELIKAMISKDEDAGELTSQLNSMCLSEEESNKVVYGPLTEAFYNVNCPFVWSEYVSVEHMESVIADLEKDIEEEVWKSFCFHLYFGYAYSRLGKLSDAFKQLEICEELLHKSADDEFYKEIKEGLIHCIQATKAHLHFLNGDAEKADEIISSVVPLQDLTKPSKAAVIVLNADVMKEFSPEAKEVALTMIETAIKLDPDDHGSRRGAWYYKAGRLHGALRRMKHRAGMPSRDELQMLERAVKINPLPESLASLADAYREASASAKFGGKARVSDEVCDKMLQEAKKLYKRACEMDDQSYHTLRVCGNGLMKIPVPHRDLNLAKKCLEKAISVKPHKSAAYQALGTMEEKHFRNLDEALKNFRLSYENGNPISGAFIVQVCMKMDRNYNPIEDLDKFIKDFEGARQDVRVEYLIIKGEYLFFLRHDLLAAIKMWKEGITLTPKSENITNHVCRLLHGKRYVKPYLKYVAGRCTFNVYECLEFEIGRALNDPEYSEMEKISLEEMLQLCERNNTE